MKMIKLMTDLTKEDFRKVLEEIFENEYCINSGLDIVKIRGFANPNMIDTDIYKRHNEFRDEYFFLEDKLKITFGCEKGETTSFIEFTIDYSDIILKEEIIYPSCWANGYYVPVVYLDTRETSPVKLHLCLGNKGKFNDLNEYS